MDIDFGKALDPEPAGEVAAETTSISMASAKARFVQRFSLVKEMEAAAKELVIDSRESMTCFLGR